MKTKNLKSTLVISLQIRFVLIVFGTLFAAFALNIAYSAAVKIPIADPSILVLRHRIGLSPKPVERFVFLVLLLVVPVCGYLSALFGKPILESARDRMVRLLSIAVPFAVALAFFTPFIGFNFGQSLLSGRSMPPEHPLRVLAACLIASALWFALISRVRIDVTKRHCGVVATAVFSTALLLQIGAWRLVGEASLTVAATWWNSADAVMYSISQVAAGKTVLVDMPSQYGLFAEFAGPVLKLVGLSILSFTTLWAVLQVLCLGAVFYVVQKIVREPALRIAFGIAFVMVTFETCLWFININERYWQYWPIRFLWPALSVYAFHRYTVNSSTSRFLIVSFLGAIGSIWNADSGLVIEIALAAFLTGKFAFLLSTQKAESFRVRRALIWLMAMHVIVFVGVVSAMALYLTIKSGHVLHWSWIFEYQRLFYGIGFMMMPMPMKPSPWMSIIAVYLFGMMAAVQMWQKFPRNKVADLIFYLSFLGAGLFVYYEGRSHILNLVTVCWPALVLATILSDRVARACRAGLLPVAQLSLPVVTLSLLLFCCIPFAQNVPMLWAQTVQNFETRGVSVDPVVYEELAFIRGHSTPGQSCLVLSKRQGLYSAAAGLASPVKGPGYSELITTRDRDLLVKQLMNLKMSCVFVGVGSDSDVDLEINPLAVLSNYVIEAKSRGGTMLYLRPR